MVADLAIYTVVHQPRRLKLPAQPIPRGASAEDIARCLFDERMNERYFRKVAQYSYYPATRMFLDLVQQGMKLSIGFSLSFVRQAAAWDPTLLDLFRELVAHENVELIGVEPYHSFLFLLDLPAFITRMLEMAQELETIFGKRPVVTDTTEMCMSAPLYNALDAAGFRGAVMDGRPWVMDWRESTHLYRYGEDPEPFALPIQEKKRRARTRRLAAGEAEREGQPPFLLTRHLELSDDVGYRFSNRGWSGYPLFADTYADWLAHTWGDLLLLGWDFETFGEHHRRDSGIFDFMRALPGELTKRGVTTYTASELIERHRQNAYHLPLPIYPTTWAGSGGMEFFLGNEAQQHILQLMGHVYGMAKLTDNPELIDLALWLSQSDNLHLIQWYGRSGPEAEVSAYFTPSEWWSLGPNRVIHEQKQVYLNALRAIEPYLPARLQRQVEAGKVARSREREQKYEEAFAATIKAPSRSRSRSATL
ncbi:glycoside hydrolase family 57 protein [Tengunoibacter tsumagoiensis]|uniref:Alpha-amylase n=1 Tax=Tengunoibacter tsumagoiensis TaxID=2014871 RepID=A0A401ZTU2_9CHLR|nr:glycoside hydrolase family 57 protein [Tengunoibacter tsumagoiensis]GCE10184.1 alpha-amylase [Tengunoibacter tsumagoiensis]